MEHRQHPKRHELRSIPEDRRYAIPKADSIPLTQSDVAALDREIRAAGEALNARAMASRWGRAESFILDRARRMGTL